MVASAEHVIVEFEKERQKWYLEKEELQVQKDTCFNKNRMLNEEISGLNIQIIRLNQQIVENETKFELEKGTLNVRIDELEAMVQQKNDEILEGQKAAREKISEAQKQVTQLEMDVQVKQDHIFELEEALGSLRNELIVTRNEFEELSVQVGQLVEKLSVQEASIKAREAEFELQVKEKDDIVLQKDELIQTMLNEIHDQSMTIEPDSVHEMSTGPGSLKVFEENADLRKKVVKIQKERDVFFQKYSSLKQEVQRNKFATGGQSESENAVDNRLQTLEEALYHKGMELDEVQRDRAVIQRRLYELENTNSKLVSQLAESLMPLKDTFTDDDTLRSQFKNVQDVINDNLSLARRVEELTKLMGEEVAMADLAELQDQLKMAMAELENYRQDIDHHKQQLEVAQKQAEFYKMKAENASDAEVLSVCTHMTTNPSVTRMDFELQVHKLNCEIKGLEHRLALLADEKKRVEEKNVEVVFQKNELIAQTISSKDALQIQVYNFEESNAKLSKQLEENDKSARKLLDENGKLKVTNEALKKDALTLDGLVKELRVESERTVAEKSAISQELALMQRECVGLRSQVQSLQDNRSVTAVVVNALDDFRRAYDDLHQAQLTTARTELENARKERDGLTQIINSLNMDNTNKLDALKSALKDAELSRQNYQNRCNTAEQEFKRLQSEYNELRSKHDQLNKQLTDIDSTDADLDSCRKEIQHLRNKVVFLEKHLEESELKVEELRGQVKASDDRCSTFKQMSENFEKTMKEKDAKLRDEHERAGFADQERVKIEATLQSTIDDFKLQLQNAEQELRSREELNAATVERLNTTIAQVCEEKTAVKVGLESANSKFQDLNSQLVDLNNKNVEIEGVKQELESSKAKSAQLQDLLDTSIKDTSDLTLELQNLRTEFAEKSHEQELLINNLKQQLADIGRLQTNQEAQSVYEKACAQLDLIYGQLPAQSAGDNLNESCEGVLSRPSRLSAGFPSESSSRDETISWKKHSEVVNKLQYEIKMRNTELADRLRKIAQLEQLKDVEQRLELLQREFVAQQTKLNQLTEEKTHLLEQFNLLKVDHSSCAQKVILAERRVRDVVDQLQQAKQELDQLKQQRHALAQSADVEKWKALYEKDHKDLINAKNNVQNVKVIAIRYREQYREISNEFKQVAPERHAEVTAKHDRGAKDGGADVDSTANKTQPSSVTTSPLKASVSQSSVQSTPSGTPSHDSAEPAPTTNTDSDNSQRGVKRRVIEQQQPAEPAQVEETEEPQQKISKEA